LARGAIDSAKDQKRWHQGGAALSLANEPAQSAQCPNGRTLLLYKT